MTLWFVLALMTAVAVFAVLWPLGRQAIPTGGDDLAVYRDQMAEIERDRAAGKLPPAEAEAARIEVSRRLLAAADAAVPGADPSQPPAWRRRGVALAAFLLLPFGGAGVYAALGSPQLPGAPLAARLKAPAERNSIATLVARVEAHLAQNPEDGRGWEVLAPVYMRFSRFEDAVKARRNALRLLGATAEREADLGESLVAASDGVVTAEARESFERARGLDPKHVRARFFLGLAAEQDGKKVEAATIWRGLLADSPTDAPWSPLLREALARVDDKPAETAAGPSAAGPSAAGPSAADMAAAAELSPEQRSAMVRGMVDRLAERLRHDGSDFEGWVKLVRAYAVLGERERAQAAVADARRAFVADPDKVRQLDELAKGLGLGS